MEVILLQVVGTLRQAADTQVQVPGIVPRVADTVHPVEVILLQVVGTLRQAADTQVQVPGIARRATDTVHRETDIPRLIPGILRQAMDTIKYLLVLQETIVLEMGVFLIHMAL